MPCATTPSAMSASARDLLESLLEAVAEHAEAPGTGPRVLFMGDIVDRRGRRAAARLTSSATAWSDGHGASRSSGTTMRGSCFS